MFTRRTLLAAVLLCVPALAPADDKKEPQKRSGTVVGVVTAKDKNWIEVKAAGEARPRRYVPHWRGGAPSAGGGLDKDMLATMAKVPVGARVEIKWEFEERPRVLKIEVLKAPKKDDK
jgi:hypothetical protein